MFGECGDVLGWFPANYVGMNLTSLPNSGQSAPPTVTELPEYLAHDDISEFYTANYAYDVSKWNQIKKHFIFYFIFYAYDVRKWNQIKKVLYFMPTM